MDVETYWRIEKLFVISIVSLGIFAISWPLILPANDISSKIVLYSVAIVSFILTISFVIFALKTRDKAQLVSKESGKALGLAVMSYMSNLECPKCGAKLWSGLGSAISYYKCSKCNYTGPVGLEPQEPEDSAKKRE